MPRCSAGRCVHSAPSSSLENESRGTHRAMGKGWKSVGEFKRGGKACLAIECIVAVPDLEKAKAIASKKLVGADQITARELSRAEMRARRLKGGRRSSMTPRVSDPQSEDQGADRRQPLSRNRIGTNCEPRFRPVMPEGRCRVIVGIGTIKRCAITCTRKGGSSSGTTLYPSRLFTRFQWPWRSAMSDHELAIRAISEAQSIIEEYLEPKHHDHEKLLDRLVEVLERPSVIVAVDRLRRGAVQ
jgi:hypothetical protein